MTTTPPFDPPYKCRLVQDGAERWVDVLADGVVVECAAPAPVVPARHAAAAAGAARPPARARTILKVPDAGKDEATQWGARGGPKRKKWYVPQGADTAPFERWLDV